MAIVSWTIFFIYVFPFLYFESKISSDIAFHNTYITLYRFAIFGILMISWSGIIFSFLKAKEKRFYFTPEDKGSVLFLIGMTCIKIFIPYFP